MKTFSKILLAGVVMTASCGTDDPEIVIGLNKPIHHDDFEYTVTHVAIEKTIGDATGTLMAKGNYYIVTFLVTNNAIRVNHLWDNTIAYIKDEEGNIYENLKDVQLALDKQKSTGWQEEYVTPPKDNDSTCLVFDLPQAVRHPYLMVRGETLMGDFFDGRKFSRTKVKLF